MTRIVSIKKQSKRTQKEFYSKQRGSWNGVCPTTRIVPSGKTYNRNRLKHEVQELLY